MYSNSLLREWNSIIKAYEKDNVHLGEEARILIQNAAYDCPSYKKTIQQSEKQINDYAQKIIQFNKTIVTLEKKHKNRCKVSFQKYLKRL